MNSRLFSLVIIILFFSIQNLFSQGFSPHTQQHELPRGAYVTCIDEMASLISDPTILDSSKLDQLLSGIDQFKLDYIAMFGIDKILDTSSIDNPKEIALRFILKEIRTNFPEIEIGVVSPLRFNFEDVASNNFPYNPTTEACMTLPEPISIDAFQSRMNPSPGSPTHDYYHAYVLRFFTRILWYFNGEYSINNNQGLQQNNINTNSKVLNLEKLNINTSKGASPFFPPPQIRKDYFDWFSLEHEYWNSEFLMDIALYDLTDSSVVDTAFNDHKMILKELKNLLVQNQGCHIEIESYENLMFDNQIVYHPSYPNPSLIYSLNKSMNDQAKELIGLTDRVLFTHYFKWPNAYVDRYCLATNAWGLAKKGYKTKIWPLFSIEDSTRKGSRFCNTGDTSRYWGDFLGRWMDLDTSIYQFPFPLIPEYPFEVDEFEDEFLSQYNYAAANNKTDATDPSCNCCSLKPDSIFVGSYKPSGFMWFFLEFMQEQNIQKRASAGISVFFNENSNLNVYPNPAKEILNIPEHIDLRLFNLSGQEVKIEPPKNNILNVSNLQKGIYFLAIKTTENKSPKVIKIIIQ